jgi:catechol 2,3-dioxygenase-like lactoylglutathione lyase family enzyme
VNSATTHDTFPTLDHVGIATPDLEASIAFYTQAFALELVRGPETVSASGPAAAVHRDINGATWRGVRMAYLADARGAGVELFEFTGLRVRPVVPRLGELDAGVFHVAIAQPDLPAALERVLRLGGTQLSQLHRTTRLSLVYCADPHGIVIELVSRGFASVHGASTAAEASR